MPERTEHWAVAHWRRTGAIPIGHAARITRYRDERNRPD